MPVEFKSTNIWLSMISASCATYTYFASSTAHAIHILSYPPLFLNMNKTHFVLTNGFVCEDSLDI